MVQQRGKLLGVDDRCPAARTAATPTEYWPGLAGPSWHWQYVVLAVRLRELFDPL